MKSVVNKIIIGFVFLLSLILMLFVFPREGKFRYEFQKGKPWMHDMLIAPFDFPIYKTEVEIAAERDSILKEFKPYFNFVDEDAANQIERMNKEFDDKWGSFMQVADEKQLHVRRKYEDQLKQESQRYLNEILSVIYERGIVEISDVPEDSDQSFNIVVVRNNIAEEKDASFVFTQKSAYEYVIKLTERYESELLHVSNEEVVKEFVQSFDLNEYLESNLEYDAETSKKVKNEIIGNLSLTRGMVQAGERIISRGDVVNHEKFRILESLKREYETKIWDTTNFYLILLGQFLILFSALAVLFVFLNNFRRNILKSIKETSFVLLVIVLMVVSSVLATKFELISIYIIPFAIVPIILRTFYDARLALFIHMVVIIIVGFVAPNGYQFLFLNFVAGVAAIISLTNLYRRGKLFLAAVSVVLTYSFVYFSMAITQEGSIQNIEWMNFAYFALNGVFVLLAFPLNFIFEKAFGFLSDVTLMELSDTNQKLLRNLAEKAPGTFQHSLQVANLAEEAVVKIGGNPLLVRTGALYHDIGKLKEPQYFVENQTPHMNPHDKLEFDESAKIIIGHVSYGIELAKKHKLPKQIIDFIRTHHGTSKVQYFYKSFIKKYPDKEVDVAQFTYPGPKPFSKETAVLMMADSVEAASRSLKTITENTLSDLVDNIINYQISEEQYNEADITYKDISTIKALFKVRLKNNYHSRIEYPE